MSRPGVAEVRQYREHVDDAMARLLAHTLEPEVLDLVDLGLHHEQQHQELMLMDIKHVLSCNPLQPAYTTATVGTPTSARPRTWVEHPGGLVEVGYTGEGFAFDNELPRHTVHLESFSLASQPVTCGEWAAFIDDGGYERPDLWLSDGWATAHGEGWDAPLYWFRRRRLVALHAGRARTSSSTPPEPVCHVSYYEADAFCPVRLGHGSPRRPSGDGRRHPVTEGKLSTRAPCTPVRAPRRSPSSATFGSGRPTPESPYPGFRPAAARRR